jgi:hypothetical protein
METSGTDKTRMFFFFYIRLKRKIYMITTQ